MLYKVLRILVTLCLISVGSGIILAIISIFAGWEGPLRFAVDEIAYGLYGIVVCVLVHGFVLLFGKLPKSVQASVKSTVKKPFNKTSKKRKR